LCSTTWAEPSPFSLPVRNTRCGGIRARVARGCRPVGMGCQMADPQGSPTRYPAVPCLTGYAARDGHCHYYFALHAVHVCLCGLLRSLRRRLRAEVAFHVLVFLDRGGLGPVEVRGGLASCGRAPSSVNALCCNPLLTLPLCGTFEAAAGALSHRCGNFRGRVKFPHRR
jgi:hypothetical protein